MSRRSSTAVPISTRLWSWPQNDKVEMSCHALLSKTAIHSSLSPSTSATWEPTISVRNMHVTYSKIHIHTSSSQHHHQPFQAGQAQSICNKSPHPPLHVHPPRIQFAASQVRERFRISAFRQRAVPPTVSHQRTSEDPNLPDPDRSATVQHWQHWQHWQGIGKKCYVQQK